MTTTNILAILLGFLLHEASLAGAQETGSCPDSITFASVACRLAALQARATPPLARHLETATALEMQASVACQADKRPRARRRLGKASRVMARFVRALRRRPVKKTVPAEARALLQSEAKALRTALRTLRRGLQCPQDDPVPPARCDDGRLDPGERCDRFEGDPAANLAAATVDLDLETGSPASELDVDANGGRLARTRLDIRLVEGATVADGNRVLDAANARLVMTLANVPIVFVRIPDPGSVAALDAVVAAVAADPAVVAVTKAYLDATDELPANFSAPAPNAPAGSDPEIAKIDNHLAVRGAAAWNARGALPPTSPTVIVADKFGAGPPDAAIAATYPNPFDFDTTSIEFHGYHVTGVLAGSFGGANHCDASGLGGASGDAVGRDCVTGMMPAPITMRAVDLQLGNLTRPAKEDKLVQMAKSIGGNVVVNESLGLGFAPPAAELQEIALGWITKVRGGLVSNGTIGAGVENRVLHVTSAGNSGNASPAQRNSAPNAAALLPGLTQVVPIPNLTNTLVVENAINTSGSFLGIACLNDGSSTGGHVSAPGTEVWSLVSATSGVFDLTGTSQAAPQVAGLATYVWSLAPQLSPQQLAALLQATALRPVSGDPPVGGTCGQAVPSPTIDAYEAVLSVDAAGAATPASSPVRLAIFDVDDDGDFDDDDLTVFADALLDENAGQPRTQENPDFGRFDLNGDGFTGVPEGLLIGATETIRFDLDREGSQQFGAPSFDADPVIQVIEDVPVPFDENGVSDVSMLCYYAYSDLYTGDEDLRRALLDPSTFCFRVAVETSLPSEIPAGESTAFDVLVTITGPDGSEAPAQSLIVELSAADAGVAPASGITDGDGELAATTTPNDGVASIRVQVDARATDDGVVLASTTATATVQVDSLERLEVLTNGAPRTSQNVLLAGLTYTVRASGTFRIGGPGDGLADADFADFSNPPSSLLDTCSGSGIDFGITVDGSKREWGAFSPSHIYQLSIVGAGAPIAVGYQDCNFGDNSGSLFVDIIGPLP